MKFAHCAVVLLFLSGAACAEEETPDQKEAKEAAAEDAAEKALPEDQQFGKNFAGKLSLSISEVKTPDSVVGSLVLDNGTTYQLKLTDTITLKQLVPYDNKKCTLLGKLRNNGKYLLVCSVIDASAKPVEHRKRGGM
jgi:hypothetical protein